MKYVLDTLKRESHLINAKALELEINKATIPAEDVQNNSVVARQIVLCNDRVKEIDKCLKLLQS